MSTHIWYRTVSDTASVNPIADRSGPTIKEIILHNACDVQQDHYHIVSDDIDSIRQVIKEWCDSGSIDWIITTGGTGFGQRDVTPEVENWVFSFTKNFLYQEIFRPFRPLSKGMHQAWFILCYPRRFSTHLWVLYRDLSQARLGTLLSLPFPGVLRLSRKYCRLYSKEVSCSMQSTWSKEAQANAFMKIWLLRARAS